MHAVGMFIKVREQLLRVSSLILCESQGSNSGLPAETLYSVPFLFLFFVFSETESHHIVQGILEQTAQFRLVLNLVCFCLSLWKRLTGLCHHAWLIDWCTFLPPTPFWFLWQDLTMYLWLPQNSLVNLAGLELPEVCLPLPPECWDYRVQQPYPARFSYKLNFIS